MRIGIAVALAALGAVACSPMPKPVPEPDQTVRIEERLTAAWGGVRSCCDQERVNGAVQEVFDRWVGAQVRTNPDLKLLRTGHAEPDAGCSNSRRRTGGARSCRGSATVEAFIEFSKPKGE